jgi:HEAT repeat protein
MSVSMDDVRRALDPDEPDYAVAARLGKEALPHLERLVRGDDLMLASKAAYAASLIDGGSEVVEAAAGSDDPVVRVAAAAAVRNLPGDRARPMLRRLSEDVDPGIRKVARASERRLPAI